MGNRQSWCVHSCDKSLKDKSMLGIKGGIPASDKNVKPVHRQPVQEEPKAKICSPLSDPKVNKIRGQEIRITH